MGINHNDDDAEVPATERAGSPMRSPQCYDCEARNSAQESREAARYRSVIEWLYEKHPRLTLVIATVGLFVSTAMLADACGDTVSAPSSCAPAASKARFIPDKD